MTGICLTYRLGKEAELDHAELGRFIAELRNAGPEIRPPPNFLEIEAVIRAAYGEQHLIAEVTPLHLTRALTFLLRYLTDAIPEIRDDFDTIIDRAQAVMTRKLIGTSDQ